ncbi:tetratricopeptide repeat protein [Dactylosporangium sp. CA-092794]|uniref:serine/threonine-protein kinase n=1 Tax=Dactylosporangium sp. CA-092794 TaxID=3239929 RepID=UPI003D8E670B
MRCTRPGCTGTYAADGYCDECGHKQAARPSGVSGQPPVAPSPATRPARSSGPDPARTAAARPDPDRTAAARPDPDRTAAARPDPARTAAARPDPAPVTGAAQTSGGLGGHSTGVSTAGRRSGSGSSRGRLGAGYVAMPPVPLRDPATAIKSNASVPESQRFCSACGEPVGRGRDGQPGRTEGFCPRDRTPYSFTPHLQPGERVAGRYEILGALAHGGLGWIYLARDRNISESGADRWVVLKGLINTGDQDALEAAMAERRFLVEIDHPNIVKIHDIAEHPDSKTGEMIGYIVMEYVGGKSLKDLALENLGPDGRRVPLTLPHVLSYGIEVLNAIGYIHDRGLLFCDFKPDNVIHTEERLKLIDLGAVRRIDDQVSPLWGTPGYQAPELAQAGASIGSDIYTVGRTLAVLSFDFSGFSGKYAHSLPTPDDVELLRGQESYYRLLRRATDPDRTRRFSSAGEMADQTRGVLREILSAADGAPRPENSAQFTPERRAFGTAGGTEPLTGAAVAVALPLPLVDPTDPAAGLLATLNTTDVRATIAALRAAPARTVEVTLQLIRALVEAGDLAGAEHELRGVPAGGDWRRDWSEGLIALAAGVPKRAADAFDRVFDALPGEPAAQLALAAANELAGDRAWADWRYQRVWRVDHNFVSAAFGVARMRLAAGDRAGAVAVLDEVPDISTHHVAAQIAAVRAALHTESGPLTPGDFLDSSNRLEKLKLDKQRRAKLAVEMFHAALDWLGVDKSPGAAARPAPAVAATGRLLGQAFTEREVRFGLEQAYRSLAADESDPIARYALVDQANAVRPRTAF